MENENKDYSKIIYSPNCKDWENFLKKNLVSYSNLEITEVDNGFILPPKLKQKTSTHHTYEGGVVDSKGIFVAGLQRSKKNTSTATVNGSYNFRNDEIDVLNENVIFGGVVVNHFGHILIDTLSRLWYVIKKSDNNERIVFIFISDIDSSMRLFTPFLDLLNIDINRVIICKKITKFNRITVPNQAINSYWYANKSVLDIYDYLISTAINRCSNKFDSLIFNKLYLTRSSYSASRPKELSCLGEEYFEKFYSNRGFKIISPEKYPLVEQIYLVANATNIVTTIGTLSHFIVFAKAKSSFTILLRSHTLLVPQIILLKLMQTRFINFKLIDVSMNFIFGMHNLSVCLLGPSYNWKKYLSDNNIKFNNDDNFKSWLINIYEYLNVFYNHYSQPRYYEFIKNLNIQNIMSSISEIYTGKQFNKPKNIYDDSSDCQRLVAMNKCLQNCLNNMTLISGVKNNYSIAAKFHLSHVGWTDYYCDSEINSLNNTQEQIEAFIIYLFSLNKNLDVTFKYKVYIKNLGWQEFVSSGEIAGSIGQKLPILSIIIDKESLPSYVSVNYRVLDKSKLWSDWITPNNYFDIIDDNQLYSVEFQVIDNQQ